MTSQSSGGSGSGLPGVTSDGQTPGGEIIAGALTAGDPNAASVPSFHRLNGAVFINDAPGNSADGDNVLAINQQAPVISTFTPQALSVARTGTTGIHDYSQPTMTVDDSSGGAQPIARFSSGLASQFQVDGDGVQVHGKFKSGASVTHTLGSYSGKSIPIYDEAGTLLGYMPLYA